MQIFLTRTPEKNLTFFLGRYALAIKMNDIYKKDYVLVLYIYIILYLNGKCYCCTKLESFVYKVKENINNLNYLTRNALIGNCFSLMHWKMDKKNECPLGKFLYTFYLVMATEVSITFTGLLS